VYAFTVSEEIHAPAARVWRALCLPAEVVQWDANVTAALDAPPDYPRPGQHVRWRYATGPFYTLHDRPQEVVSERRLRALLDLGPFRFDETYVLEAGGSVCRISASLRVWLRVPVVGGLLVRRYTGPQARTAVERALSALKRHCEPS
jgi:Polyketide cyclase / dehydrase and lipid transport